MVRADLKKNGVFYTPDTVTATLLRWAVRSRTDRLLDPACGDGRFLTARCNSVGIERDSVAATLARDRAPDAQVVVGDFFEWVEGHSGEFDVVAGNPPFIRYQHFSGTTRFQALDYCSKRGVQFSSLTSSWAPFLVAAASTLRRGGRLAFVVPAEIGHAPYATPLLYFLLRHFANVQLIAIREKLFPQLSEDAWLLLSDGFGGSSDRFHLSALLGSPQLNGGIPKPHSSIGFSEWKAWNCRLRPFLLPALVRETLRELAESRDTVKLGDIARVSIGYVTGANDYFHIRPSQAKRLQLLEKFLVPTVRKGSLLPEKAVTHSTVNSWLERDDPALLLHIRRTDAINRALRRYLESDEAEAAKTAYKCRTRSPWFCVPDVRFPQAFLTYLSGESPALVMNAAGCTCTNSVHTVVLRNGYGVRQLVKQWVHPLTQLSCEIEGHPLGGGVLKLEPTEATQVVLPGKTFTATTSELATIREGIALMRGWRHYGNGTVC